MRRSCYQAVEGYNINLKTAEDFDLWLRILRKKTDAAYLDEPLVWYRSTAGSLSANTLQMQKDTLQVYEYLAKSEPDIYKQCQEEINKARYLYFLTATQKAMKEKRYNDFFTEPQNVFKYGNNPKLKAVNTLAKISPNLTHYFCAIHENMFR